MNIWEEWNPFKASEEQILANKRANRIYVADFTNNEGKYISMVFDEKSEPFDLKLQISPRVEVRITFLTKDEKIQGVQISKLSGGTIERINLSTLGFEGVLAVLKIFSEIDLKAIGNKSIVLDSSIIQDEGQLRTHLKTILTDEKGLKIISELATSKGLITEGDIGNLSKKREALKTFEGLLNNVEFFASKKTEWKKTKDEDVWQKYFEDNKWIFGYGLEYVFNAPIDKEKLEQTLLGNSFLTSGKRPDGILKTLGLTQFLNVVEIKTHANKLMDSKMYRDSGVWQISSELAGAISQCQQYIRISIQNLSEFFELKDKDGNRTKEEVFCFNPKCFLIIGNTKNEFLDDQGRVVNIDKLSCFEYFRKNIVVPEIITYDQLYLRAKNIIEHNT